MGMTTGLVAIQPEPETLIDDPAAAAELLRATGVARPEINDAPWGTIEMSVSDPFGNRISFVDSKDG